MTPRPDPIDPQAKATLGCGLASAAIILCVFALLAWGVFQGYDFLFGVATK